ncbi:MAG: ester cyclase [Chitinophagaceae bacterium]
MKRLLSLFSIAALCCCLSCNNDKTASDATAKDNSVADKNLAAATVVMKSFETGDASGIDSVVAADFVDHNEKGDMGRDSLKSMITTMKQHCTNTKSEVIKQLADNDYVMMWVRQSGNTDGTMGMPAGPYEMTSVETIKYKDGKAVEHWTFMEPREMMKMMPPPPPPMDPGKDKMKGK